MHKHKNTAILAILFQLLLILFPGSQVCAQTGHKVADKFINNVVQLSVTFTNNGKKQDGFGFVAGEQDGRLYAVTAKHVVRSDMPKVNTEEIRVRFYRNKGKSYRADLLELSYPRSRLSVCEHATGHKPACKCKKNIG
ncbi:hypothetical protein QUF80_15805 [Desulfococcaceae bacterium HSG8]|nr:hypothetical protein [Desulfococcaceae bacterium HSG8]